MLSIKPIKAYSDNYIWLVSTNEGSIVVDPGEADQVLNLCESNDIDLKGILITHHHYDHTNGLDEILKHKKVEVYGPKNNISLINKRVCEGDEFNIIGLKFKVIEVPAHTLDHIAFICEDETIPFIFCGDTLFSGGCGRVFEGSFEQMFLALQKIKKLPSNTKIFCGHEYTTSNLEFACEVEPTNEYKINPFLRCDNEFIINRINDKFGETNSEIEIFTALRKWKDSF